MSTFLVDTSVLIDVLQGVPDRVENLKALVEAGHILACSAITVGELFAGMRPKERAATVALLDSLEHFDVTRINFGVRSHLCVIGLPHDPPTTP